MANRLMNNVIDHLRRAVLAGGETDLTDGQLLECFVSRRDEAAVAALVRRHGSMVWGVCRRVLRNHHNAEDAFQATFLVLVRKAATIMPREMVANWLYGVAHQTALKARATMAKRQAREKQMNELPEPEAGTEPDLWRDLQPVLDQELARLPDKYRVAIALCDLEGKSRKEAARQLKIHEGTLSSRLTTARKMLAKRMFRHGLVVSCGALAAALSQSAASACVPTSVVSSTIKAASLFAAGQAAAGVISAKVAALTEGVLKAMSMTKLKIATAVLLVIGTVGVGVGTTGLHGMQAANGADTSTVQYAQVHGADKPQAGAKNGGTDAPKKDGKKKDGKKAKKEAREGILLAELEKVDSKEGIITVTRLGTLVGGLGDQRGGIGFFKNNIRLENLPVAKTARILVNGKEAKLTDLKPGMAVSLQLVVKGGIAVREITAESK